MTGINSKVKLSVRARRVLWCQHEDLHVEWKVMKTNKNRLEGTYHLKHKQGQKPDQQSKPGDFPTEGSAIHSKNGFRRDTSYYLCSWTETLTLTKRR